MKAIAMVPVLLCAWALPLMADAGDLPDVQGQPDGERQYDRKIEQAAIRRAATKMGELRGTIEGVNHRHLIAVEDLSRNQTRWLGFPVLEEPEVSES